MSPSPWSQGEAPRTRWGVVQVDDAAVAASRVRRDLRVAPLHGRMPSDEKDAVMQAFAARRDRRAGRHDGHRGGRRRAERLDDGRSSTPIGSASRSCTSCAAASAAAAFPVCACSSPRLPLGTPARERVDAVAATLDGFDLAEVDLELRGEGDVLGDAQSGARSSLRLLRVVKDADLIAEAADRRRADARRRPRARRATRACAEAHRAARGRWRSARRSRRTDAGRSAIRRADRLIA